MTCARDSLWNQEQQNDLSVAEVSLPQPRRFGSHRGHSGESQARRCGQGSTDHETVHHSTIVDEHGGTPGCPRYEGRGTMTHSETCRKRFEEIEMKKLDKRLEEECARIRERPSETVNEMDVE